jgi:hypothetical protein
MGRTDWAMFVHSLGTSELEGRELRRRPSSFAPFTRPRPFLIPCLLQATKRHLPLLQCHTCMHGLSRFQDHREQHGRTPGPHTQSRSQKAKAAPSRTHEQQADDASKMPRTCPGIGHLGMNSSGPRGPSFALCLRPICQSTLEHGTGPGSG